MAEDFKILDEKFNLPDMVVAFFRRVVVNYARLENKIESDKQEKYMKMNELHEKPKPDQFTLKKIQTLHPAIRSDVERIYYELLEFGIAIRIAQAFRSFAEQDALLAKGGVTEAKGGQSFHNYGIAFDFCLLLPDGRDVTWDREKDLNTDNVPDWKQVIDSFKSIGFKSGGDWSGKFKDYPHLEKTFGFTWQQLLAKYQSGDFIPSTNFVRLEI